MHQQEFEPQQNEQLFNTSSNFDSVQDNMQEREARPYYWSTKLNTGNAPKYEHPANFEDSLAEVPPIPPYSYQAQDQVFQQQPQKQTQNTSAPAGTPPRQQARPRGLSPDGDAMEHGYRPYNSYNMHMSSQVPPWARPQRSGKAGRIALLVIVGLLLAKPLLIILGLLLGAFLVFAGVALAILLVGASVILMGVLAVLLIMGRPNRFLHAPWQRRRW